MTTFLIIVLSILIITAVDCFCEDDSQVAQDVREIKEMLKEKNG